jgi:hypothetical protein
VFAELEGRGKVLPVSIVIDLVVLALLLARQVTTRPLSGGYRLPLILVIVGLFESAAFLLGGGQQLAHFLLGHRSLTTIHDGPATGDCSVPGVNGQGGLANSGRPCHRRTRQAVRVKQIRQAGS